ncbi:hypothetical protein [Seonamhaeicola sp. ML3]|uniref:hypothetical protein n=1 Tax=Seonamhaeicola sp. ML3 TaxID=2937786 RepID=UPI00200C18CD|nr:hypothetical protein [Seonamhaeicola sp. ML3]
MKIFHKILLVSFISFSLFSCSKDDIDENELLYGVWDNVKFDGDKELTLRLFFGPDNTGGRIRSTEDAEGVVSSSESFEWSLQNDQIEITDSYTNSKEEYYINSFGKLVSKATADLVLDKVSDDYSRYYDGK